VIIRTPLIKITFPQLLITCRVRDKEMTRVGAVLGVIRYKVTGSCRNRAVADWLRIVRPGSEKKEFP